MGYFHIKDFKRGMDRRRSTRIGGDPGSLWSLVNGHISRGGDIEQRKKFVEMADLAGSFGLAVVSDTPYVFGHAADPGIAGVTYQRLQHPDGTTAMTEILYAGKFKEQLHVIAKYADGNTYMFVDGVISPDWVDGIVRADMMNNEGVAEHLKALIDADSRFTATRSGSVITVTGAAGAAFDVHTQATNATGGTDDQTFVANTTQAAVAAIAENVAQGYFEITGGAQSVAATGSVELTSGGSGSVDGITVDGVQIMSGAVNYDTSLANTATLVAANITAHTSSPNYTATADGEVITISAVASLGARPNGFTVVSSTTTIAATDTDMGNGVTHEVTSVLVDGIEVLNTPVGWVTSNSVTAGLVAAQITSYASNPEYTATAVGNRVVISAAAGTGITPNGFVVAPSVVGSVTIGNVNNMAGGSAAVAGVAQITTLTVGGTFGVGDRFGATLDGTNFGAIGKPTPQATSAKTFKDKVYAACSTVVNYSGIGSASIWDRDSLTAPGGGFFTPGSQSEGAQDVVTVDVYEGLLAVFCEETIQTWSVEADDSLNFFVTALPNTGTKAPRSTVPFGNTDLFYLSPSGFRSVRARDQTGAAFISDVGSPIDPFVRAHVDSLADAVVRRGIGILEPEADRCWMSLDNRIYVFSFFPSNKINAWSYYDLTDDIGAGVAITDMARSASKIYVRAGDKLYLYGGANGTTYPDAGDSECVVDMPFMDLEKPAHEKEIQGWDIACQGDWSLYLRPDPSDVTKEIFAGTANKTTFNQPVAALHAVTSHFSARLVHVGSGGATVSQLAIHYQMGEAA